MKSGIYEGVVRHRRAKPFHRFRYSLFMMYLDLAELDRLFEGRWLWSADRFNVACFNRAYHLGDVSVPLEQAVRDLVSVRLGRRPEGPVRVLTQLRYFGFQFNPVSFYYCFDRAGERVGSVIVEIRNTPWGELFCYVLGGEAADSEVGKAFSLSKEFHVSPFMDMDVRYRWEFTEPGDSVSVLMTSYANDRQIFDAELAMERREITGAALSRVLLRYPFMNVKILGAIYWQALRLRIKGARFFAHPSKRSASPGLPAP